jgi:hypothetical protein
MASDELSHESCYTASRHKFYYHKGVLSMSFIARPNCVYYYSGMRYMPCYNIPPDRWHPATPDLILPAPPAIEWKPSRICAQGLSVDDVNGLDPYEPVGIASNQINFNAGNMLEYGQIHYGDPIPSGVTLDGIHVLRAGWYKISYSFQIDAPGGAVAGTAIYDATLFILRDHLANNGRDDAVSDLTLSTQGTFKSNEDVVHLFKGDFIHLGVQVDAPEATAYDFSKISFCINYLHP